MKRSSHDGKIFPSVLQKIANNHALAIITASGSASVLGLLQCNLKLRVMYAQRNPRGYCVGSQSSPGNRISSPVTTSQPVTTQRRTL